MICIRELYDLKKELENRSVKENYDLELINIINNYLSENNYYDDIQYGNKNIYLENIKFDEIFSENELNNLYSAFKNYKYPLFTLLNFNCLKIPKIDIENLFKNCFSDIDYLYTYHIDFEYNCIHIDKKISFEKLIEINNFFQKYNILISYDFSDSVFKQYNEIIITFENCCISEYNKYIGFNFELLPNKYMRCY